MQQFELESRVCSACQTGKFRVMKKSSEKYCSKPCRENPTPTPKKKKTKEKA